MVSEIWKWRRCPKSVPKIWKWRRCPKSVPKNLKWRRCPKSVPKNLKWRRCPKSVPKPKPASSKIYVFFSRIYRGVDVPWAFFINIDKGCEEGQEVMKKIDFVPFVNIFKTTVQSNNQKYCDFWSKICHSQLILTDCSTNRTCSFITVIAFNLIYLFLIFWHYCVLSNY